MSLLFACAAANKASLRTKSFTTLISHLKYCAVGSFYRHRILKRIRFSKSCAWACTQEQPKILASCDNFGSFARRGAGSYLSGSDQAEPKQSTKSVQGWWTAFCIMILRVVVSGKVKQTRSRSESESERAFSQMLQTRSQVIYPWPSWSKCNSLWRTELVPIETGWDELWIGVKGQTNLVIAGSLRNIFRYSLK